MGKSKRFGTALLLALTFSLIWAKIASAAPPTRGVSSIQVTIKGEANLPNETLVKICVYSGCENKPRWEKETEVFNGKFSTQVTLYRETFWASADIESPYHKRLGLGKFTVRRQGQVFLLNQQSVGIDCLRGY